MRPYIGITDFTSVQEVLCANSVLFHRLPPGSDRLLHVGVMTSFKTLHGIPSRWTDIFPSVHDLRDIFACPHVYNCLHYADYEGQEDPSNKLTQVLHKCGPHLHALQLDMIWPDPEQINRWTSLMPSNFEVVLQVGKPAMEYIHHDPNYLVERLREYEGSVHRVLLDMSMGRGVPMEASTLMPHLEILQTHLPHLGLVVAGGLGPFTIHLAQALIAEFPNISIDAQSKLRASGNAMDPIDWPYAHAYLIKAADLFSNARP